MAYSEQPLQIRLAPTGWYTRYLLGSYLRHAAIVVGSILLIALTIDFSPRLPRILAARPGADAFEALALICRYGALRSADILARNFPIAMYLAVLWTELAHTRSLERIAVSGTGRSPLQCLVPVLILGMGAGLFQLTLDLWLRPAAVAVQIRENLGDYGSRFARTSTEVRWFVSGDDLISAKIEFATPPRLRDISLYRLKEDGRLNEVVIARTAEPLANSNVWLFRDGSNWSTIDVGDVFSPVGEVKEEATPREFFLEKQVRLSLDPLWVSNFGINGKYLPQGVLYDLAYGNRGVYERSDYLTWMHVRFAHGLQALAVVLLASSIGMLALSTPLRIRFLVGMMLTGYAGHAAMKTFEILGELAYLPAPLAAWSPPVLLLIAVAYVQWKANSGLE